MNFLFSISYSDILIFIKIYKIHFKIRYRSKEQQKLAEKKITEQYQEVWANDFWFSLAKVFINSWHLLQGYWVLDLSELFSEATDNFSNCSSKDLILFKAFIAFSS